MGYLLHSVLVFVLFCNVCVYTRKIPSYIKICHLNDPNVDNCIVEGFQTALKHAKANNGIPDLLVPPINPLVIPEVTLNNEPNLKVTFKNVKFYGFDNVIVKHAKSDIPHNHFEASAVLPAFRAETDFDVNGGIIVRLVGKGSGDANFTNVMATLVANGDRYKKNGKEHFRFKTIDMDVNLGKPTFHFNGVFSQSSSDSLEEVNKLVNDNIETILEQMKPIVNDAISQFILGIINRFYDAYTTDELFPQ